MIELKTLDIPAGAQRLVANQQLTPEDFVELSKRLGASPINARKIGFVAARQTDKNQLIETLWNGVESQVTARKGDWIVTNLDPQENLLRDDDDNFNQYAIKKNKFPQLYERHEGENDYGQIYRAISQVEALYLSGGFEILAPWGALQKADDGYLLSNGFEIYGNHKQTFDETYELIGE